jgi:DMSO/TMAO reductase YedYZ heme-binding membrane subunit
MTTWSAVTWDTARAGGFAAYILLSLAVSVGLVLRNRWQTPKWPRLITNELHGYLSLLALVFIVVHVLAVLVDPFTHFGLAEVLVPLVSHYRPVWMGLGIVALYLLLAVWVSSRLRSRIGYGMWRRIHVLAYGVYVAATIHGLGTGSDTRSVWAPIVYASSVVVVGGLAARRLLVPAARGQRRRPALAAVGGGIVVLATVWAVAGPLAAHWGARAGGVTGRRSSVSTQRAQSLTTKLTRARSGTVRTPLRASFRGSMDVQPVDASGRLTIRIDGALRGGTRDHLEIYLQGVPLEEGGVAMERSRVRMGAETALYHGEIVGLRGSQLVASLHSARQDIRLAIALDLSRADGSVSGTVLGTSAHGREPSIGAG